MTMLGRILLVVIMFPSRMVCALTEVAVSRRGAAVAFFAVCGLFVVGPWLRPILSFDLRATHIPLAIWQAPDIGPAELLSSPREFRYDSIGAVLLVLIGGGLLVALFKPRMLGICAGVLTCAALAATAEVTLNHPALIDLMDAEVLQRTQLAAILREESEQSLAANSPPRTTRLRLPAIDNAPIMDELEYGDMFRGWFYGMYGPWLVFTAAFTVLVQTRGAWQRRLAHLGFWSTAGLALAGAVCSRRLLAEYHWDHAQELERIGSLAAASKSLSTAQQIFPEFTDLDRTWRLAGKIDYRRGWNTREEIYFRIVQLSEQGERAAALSLTAAMLARDKTPPLAVRNLAGVIFADLGRKHLNQGLYVAAQDAYRRVYNVAPYRVDCVVALGAIWMHTDRFNPERIEEFYGQLAQRVGDRLLRADLMERIGHAYFEDNQFAVARDYYQKSLETFAQPKFPNPPAQEGMVGM